MPTFVAPTEWTPADLAAAQWLSLTSIVSSPAAVSFVEHLVARVVEHEAEGRKNRRREDGLAKLRTAVAAVAGGLLRSWGGSTPRWSFHPVDRSSFSGERIPFRQFDVVTKSLVALGFVTYVRGFAEPTDFDGDGQPVRSGLTARFAPTGTLLAVAESYGITPATIREHFTDSFPEEPPEVQHPVILRPLKPPRRKGTARGPVAPLSISDNDPDAQHYRSQVRSFNRFAERFNVNGCRPPRWYRTFTADWLHGGRWIAAGNEGNYQRMPQAQRLRITIDGRPVVSLDVSASHLSLMIGLAKAEMPDGDPYGTVELPRAAVKHLVMVTAGRGSLPSKWPASTPDDIASIPLREATDALVEVYPFLREPWRLLHRDRQDSEAKRLLVHRLMYLEAGAVTHAMEVLSVQKIFAMPVFDELIVPEWAAEQGKAALLRGYRAAVGTEPTVKVTAFGPLA